MARNPKCKKICAEFKNSLFYAKNIEEEFVRIYHEELEAMRLCDFEGLDQEEAATRMQISRGTFQRILYSGRKKTTKALCAGYNIFIEGGNYEVKKEFCKRYPTCKHCTHKVGHE